MQYSGANQFAKRFSLRDNLIFGADDNIGNGDEDPKKKQSKNPTPDQIARANAIVKEIARRKQMVNWENTNVGNKIPNIVDEQGNVLGNILQQPPQPKLPFGTITDIRRIPSYVTDKDIQKGSDNVPYYIDQTTGDIQYIHPDILRSSRFNPHRGQTSADAMASNIFGNRFGGNF